LRELQTASSESERKIKYDVMQKDVFYKTRKICFDAKILHAVQNDL